MTAIDCEYDMNRLNHIGDDLVAAFNDGYKQGKADAERKRGKWLDVTTLDNEFICWVCSECRHGADFVYEPYNYCPNCGADMRGES